MKTEGVTNIFVLVVSAKKYLMTPSFIVMAKEADVLSATHGGFYLLIHCSIAALQHTPNTPIGQKSLNLPTVQCNTLNTAGLRGVPHQGLHCSDDQGSLDDMTN